MFPNKIKLTDEYIDLIVKKRKEHNLTAYQLSEKIGKNKSWLPNIENHRTKNLAKDDLFLIFSDFAKEENIDTELYIIKYLHPNTMIELDNGQSIICSSLQNRYELLSWDSKIFEYWDNYNFYNDEIPRQHDISYMKSKLAELNETILNEFSYLPEKERANSIDTIDNIEHNFQAHFELANYFYGIDLFKYAPTNWYSNYGKQFITEVSKLIENLSLKISLLNAQSQVYSFISDSHDCYTIANQIANYDSWDLEELHDILERIEEYIFTVYNYIDLKFKLDKENAILSSNEYHKMYSIMDRLFHGFLNIAKLSYDFKFDVPSNDATEIEIKEAHLKATNILFQIKQAFNKKYNI